MKNTFTGKAATFILSLAFFSIIVSFIFGNYDNFTAPSRSDVANVDGLPVTVREYQMRLSQQIDFFNQMMGGQITQQQIQQMGIKESVLSGMIQQKLLLSAGSKMGLALSESELKEEIKRLPPFQRDGQFDVARYKQLLQMNQYSPAQFEEMVGNDIINRKMEQMLNAATVSENFAKDILSFKLTGLKVEAIRVDRPELVNLVEVTPQEVKEFAAAKDNQKLLEALYTENSAKYNKPEEIKARHILFRAAKPEDETKAHERALKLQGQLTAKNFAEKAKALTEDPSGKANGGDLGWFSKGRMVPEFESAAFPAKVGTVVGPIKTNFGYHYILVEGRKGEQKRTLEEAKEELARSTLQKRKTQELDKLMNDEKVRLQAMLAAGNTKAIEAEKKRVELTLLPSAEVNQYDMTIGSQTLTVEEGKKLFAATAGDVLDFSNAGGIFLLKVIGTVQSPAEVQKKVAEQVKTEVVSQAQLLSRKMREDLLKELNAKAKVVTNPSLL